MQVFGNLIFGRNGHLKKKKVYVVCMIYNFILHIKLHLFIKRSVLIFF